MQIDLHSQSEVRAAPARPSLTLSWPQTLCRPEFWTELFFLLTPSLPLWLFLGLSVACKLTREMLLIPAVIYIGITTVNSL